MIKKNINKQGIIVIIVGLVAAVLFLTFIFSNPIETTPGEEIILEENGEASYLNLSVPNSKQKEDSLSLIDKLEKIKLDSVNNARMNTTGLEEIEKKANAIKENEPIINNSSSFKKNEVSLNKTSSNTSNKTQYKASSFDEPINNSNQNEASIITERSEKTKNKESGFFKKSSNKNSDKTTNNSDLIILASIHTNQTVMNNQRVKFRTTKEFYYNGLKYPINTIIYGFAQIKPNRLLIKINKINQTDIKLEVYDSEDSEQGLYVLTPNLNASLQKELKKEGIEDDDLRNIPFSRSLKSIFEKKVKEEKVYLLNNYKVLIKLSEDE